MKKIAIAFLLGLFSFVLMMVVGESAGLAAAFIVIALYFFSCQFGLSRGNTDAHIKDWPVMLALDAVILLVIIIQLLVERKEVFFTQGIGLMISGFGGTYAGAVVASWAARRTLAAIR